MERSDSNRSKLVSRTTGKLLLAALLAVQGTQWASTGQPEPAARALSWEHPDAEAARLRIERMAEELTPWGQVDYSARLRPLLRFQGHPGGPDAGDPTARFGVSARVNFAERPATHARRLQTLERARQGLYRLRLRGVRDALLAHAALLLAQEQEARELRELAEADAALAAATASDATATPIGASELRAARLEQRKAALDYRRAQHELAQARGEAARYGFADQARYQPLRFALPEADGAGTGPEYSHEYRMLELELLEAEAELDETRAGPLDDLRLGAAYRTRTASVDLEGGIVNGRPGATLGLSAPGGPERWQLQISAEIVLDDSWLDLPHLEQDAGQARAHLSAFPERFRDEVQRAITEAELVEAALALAEEDVAISEELLAERWLESDDLAAAALSEAANTSAIERALTRAKRDLARSERAAGSARVRLYRAWIAYVRAVASLLETTGGTWELLPPSSVDSVPPTAARLPLSARGVRSRPTRKCALHGSRGRPASPAATPRARRARSAQPLPRQCRRCPSCGSRGAS